jgi:Tfp pilus assembly protein PilZ
MRKMSGKERRMYPRLRVRWAVSIQAADGLRQGEMENISLGGAFIRCDKPPRSNEKVLLTYKDHSHNMKVLAQVAWINRESGSGGDKPTGMGVQFLQFLGTTKPDEKSES